MLPSSYLASFEVLMRSFELFLLVPCINDYLRCLFVHLRSSEVPTRLNDKVKDELLAQSIPEHSTTTSCSF